MTSFPSDKYGVDRKSWLPGEVRTKIRTLHYSRRTEKSYTQWVKRYILFHGKRHPRDMRADEVQAFLSALATEAPGFGLDPESGAGGVIIPVP